MDSVREVLRRVGTWDLVRLHCGGQLRGDYQGCQYIALNREETDTLEFSRVKNLSPDLLLALLGHTPQVSLASLHWLRLATRTRGTVWKWGLNAVWGASSNGVKPEAQQVAVGLYDCFTQFSHSPLILVSVKHWFYLCWRLQNITVILQLFENNQGWY